jgi:ABC-2 type transport system ATP-binding protein
MWHQIACLAADHGKTVLLTTHYLEEADRLASRLAIVDRGKVVAEGTPDELKREQRVDRLDDVYLRHTGRTFEAAEREELGA